MHHLTDVPESSTKSLGPSRLLIVDDNAATRQLMCDVLKGQDNYEVDEAGNGVEALKMLEETSYDLIISDISMPNMDGISLLEEIRKIHPDLPVIMATGFGGDIGPRTLELGADDCIYLPFRVEEFTFRVSKALRVRQLEKLKESLLERNRELWGRVITDPLTRVFTRAYFDDVFRTEFERSRRYRSDLGLIIIDIDHFKSVNDVYGHLVGDQVLRRLGEMMMEAIRRVDLAARYGGEEFVMLLPATSRAGIQLVGERLREQVEGTKFTYEEAGEMKEMRQVTISLGAVHYPDERYSSPRELLKASDDLLYKAKNGGRNRLETDWN
jgi:diguanylate cyclase (GGDEF)-like protein